MTALSQNIGGAMNKPPVTIIMPVYNAEKYLGEAIQSVIDQTWPNKQLIIVNDGSTDDSLAIAQTYANNCITIIDQPNSGAAKARNTGLAQATGKYIQFIDADDLLSPDKIQEQVTLLEANPGKIAVSSTVHFPDGEDHLKYQPSIYEEQFLINAGPIDFLTRLWGGFSKNGSMVTIHAWLAPKEFIDDAGLWNETLTVDDDGEFFARVILRSKGIIKSKGTSYYRKFIHQKSLSAQKNLAGLNSRLNAFILKKKLLLNETDSLEAKSAIYKAGIVLAADSYLEHPEIYKKAIAELPPIKLNYTPPTGGKLSDLFSSVFGWRATKYFKRLLEK